MARNSSLRRFLHNVYGYAFFNKLILLTPVYAVFMQSHGLGGMLGSWRYSVMILGMILIGVGCGHCCACVDAVQLHQCRVRMQ